MSISILLCVVSICINFSFNSASRSIQSLLFFLNLSLVLRSLSQSFIVTFHRSSSVCRLPVILWCHPGSGDVIARSSQPLFGLMMNMRSLDKAVELNYQWIAFDDVCYHVQVTVKNPNLLLLVVSLPNPPPEAMSFDGLPLGAIEAIKATYRTGFQEVEVLSHITWKPKWGMIFSDIKKKVSRNCEVSQRSTMAITISLSVERFVFSFITCT
ncbi:predicted protein [Arabidopsis lyrata subsp. lyrata]|uniref:Predicted protein n=1 Tax=Arabidopsis lyrata subsp. lyrata TaxID=81972 RepID=D7LNH4_ARALL|nr:predicted protein [Arabidopsis lyrata subsp. lyrata]